MNRIRTTYPRESRAFAVRPALEHPSASVKPDSHASCNEMMTGFVIRTILGWDPPLLSLAFVHLRQFGESLQDSH